MKSNSKSFKTKHGKTGSNDAKGSGNVANKKQAKRNADTYVDNAVAIQKKIDHDSPESAESNREMFNNAYNLFRKALDTYPDHSEALYGLGVLTLEKLDYDMSCLGLTENKFIGEQVMTALSYFDRVIANDTSRRGDTTGLAHRSCAVAILQHFKVISGWCFVDATREVDCYRYIQTFKHWLQRSRDHFKEVCTVLVASISLDLHIVEFCTLLQEVLRIYDDMQSASLTREWLLIRARYCNYTFDLLHQVALQSQFSNGQDRTILIIQAEVYTELFEFYYYHLELKAKYPHDLALMEGTGTSLTEAYSHCGSCVADVVTAVLRPVCDSTSGTAAAAAESMDMHTDSGVSCSRGAGTGGEAQHYPEMRVCAEEVDLLAAAASLCRQTVRLQRERETGTAATALDCAASISAGTSTSTSTSTGGKMHVSDSLIQLLDICYAVAFNRPDAVALGDLAESLLFCTNCVGESGSVSTLAATATDGFNEYINGLFAALHGGPGLGSAAVASVFALPTTVDALLRCSKLLYCRAVATEVSPATSDVLCRYCTEYISAVCTGHWKYSTADGVDVPGTVETANIYNLAAVCYKLRETDQSEFLLSEYLRLEVAAAVRSVELVGQVTHQQQQQQQQQQRQHQQQATVRARVREELLSDSDFRDVHAYDWFQRMLG